ncbi:MAG: lipoprotein signal peptidase [Chitinophagaceae bacterium]|nr:lipoprotein signal peptidase [Chitinophagaceae bacterium]
MKFRAVVIIIVAIIVADQALKIWVKTNMHYGEHITLIPNWFRLYFIENAGMAWGWKFGGDWGKMALTLFRLIAVIFGVFYIRSIIRKQYHRGFIICVGLIFAGALGNLIDSLFYGLLFDKGMLFDAAANDYSGYSGLAKFSSDGYSNFLYGNVVDMLYVPIIENKTLPSWVPFWGGENFTFFSPIFNIADASISIGVIVILLFQKRFFKKHASPENPTIETNTPVNDTVHVS